MASRDKKASKASSSRAGRIRTLSDLNRHSAESDSDSDGPQEYYTGGEKSGMLVQDPSKGNDVDAIFNQARQQGAIERPLDQIQEPPRSTSFTGAGRLLSGERVQSASQQLPEAVVHNIVFWSNGFTVNDGPLRSLDDPENAAFLESIKKSECPKELEPADRRSSVNVNLIRRSEKYPEPEKRHVPFQGVGRTLRSSSSSAAPEPTVTSTPPGSAPTPSAGLVVDQSLPSTSIQLSGMLVQDPSKGNDVDAIFNQARQQGAIERPLDQIQEPPRSTSFPGTGRLLSEESVQSASHNIVFWSNGFTVNDGPLRSLDDPENAAFLESIKKSECPKELEPADRRSSVNVNLIRRSEKYPSVGRTVGSSSSSAAPEPTVTSTPPGSAPTPSAGLVVDQSLPSTSIQLRLADGTRVVSQFNYHHTIRDIRAFIDASKPGSRRNYQLQMMGFPPKLLTDETQTIEQAGLANSVVIQKF